MNGPEDQNPPDGDSAAGENALRWVAAHHSGERIAECSRARRRRKRRVRGTAGALAIAAIVVSGGMFWGRQRARLNAISRSASIVVAEPERKILPDGSVVELASGAKIAVNYGPRARLLTLIRGEAHFAVKKNRDIPFIVAVGGVQVRAVGTAFLVQLDARQVAVLVTEGRVAVDKSAAEPSTGPGESGAGIGPMLQTIALVAAGNRAVVEIAAPDAAPSIAAVSRSEENQLLAWRAPRIELSGTPLSEALRVFNRYSGARLELDDPALGSLELSGVLRPNNPDALLRVLKIEFGLEADRSADGKIVLRRPASSQNSKI